MRGSGFLGERGTRAVLTRSAGREGQGACLLFSHLDSKLQDVIPPIELSIIFRAFAVVGPACRAGPHRARARSRPAGGTYGGLSISLVANGVGARQRFCCLHVWLSPKPGRDSPGSKRIKVCSWCLRRKQVRRQVRGCRRLSSKAACSRKRGCQRAAGDRRGHAHGGAGERADGAGQYRDAHCRDQLQRCPHSRGPFNGFSRRC